jgi:PAS domain S-box-containing protein
MPDGKIKWHAATSSFSYSTLDGAKIFTGIILDITDRKFADEERLKNEKRFRLTLAKIGDSAWEHNLEQDYTLFSEGIYNLSGYKASELEADIDLWRQCVHPADQWLIRESDIKYKLGSQDSHHFEYRIFHKDGSMKWILDRGAVIESTSEGMAKRIVGIHTDISTEKALYERLLIQEQQKKKEILQAVLEAQEREREEISYELHENINQVLSVCKLMLDLALKEKESVTLVLQTVMNNIKRLIDEIRTISHGLSTSTLQQIGLPQAIEVLLGRANVIEKISFQLDASGYQPGGELNSDILLTIFRVTQEQIMNISNHSGATHATIRLGITQNEIWAEISDDGNGFDKHTTNKGLGMVNMVNRVESYNGKIELDTQPGKGCCLKVIIPIAGS